jgi:UDP-glucuronate decarboxylase
MKSLLNETNDTIALKNVCHWVRDTVAGLLIVMLFGKCGEAYNIADEKSDISLKNLSEIIADNAGKNVIYDIPDAI